VLANHLPAREEVEVAVALGVKAEKRARVVRRRNVDHVVQSPCKLILMDWDKGLLPSPA
jgi:hypothetical protein